MIVGKVVGSVVSTRKCEKLIGSKFMIIEPVHHMKGDLSQLVAIDMIGAGVGEYVLVAQGSAARIGCGVETAPVDAAGLSKLGWFFDVPDIKNEKWLSLSYNCRRNNWCDLI